MTPVAVEGPCTTVATMLNTAGYARTWVGKGRAGRRMVYAHRHVWEQAHGPIPDGMTIDHLCFTRNCIRLSHLALVTADANRRRQQPRRNETCRNGHQLTPDNVFTRGGNRRCKTCNEARLARYEAKRR